jgi:hypothetical protein
MPDDSINTLIGTFSYIPETIGAQAMDQCICIDTSTNRIGINTLTPEYAIDIKNFSSTNPQYIRTPRLIISDISRLPFANTIPNISLLNRGEIYVDASNYLRIRE